MYCAGNVIFQDADSASKAILGLGTVASAEELPDGFGETTMLHNLCQKLTILQCLQGSTISIPPYPSRVQPIPIAV